MTEKLKPCKCGEPVVYHAPEAADELGWILCPKCFCEMSEFHFSSPDEMFTAWNTRATGWRPIEEAEDSLKDGWVAGCNEHGWFKMQWVEGYGWCAYGRLAHPTHFQEITPPNSEAPHD